MKSIALVATLAAACLLAACGKNESGSPAASSASAIPSSSSSAAAPSVSSTGPAPTASSNAGNSTAASGNAAATAGGGTATASSGGTAAVSVGAGADGQKVFAATCVACHAAGVAGAPKLGDKADWGPRIAQGNDTLYQHAIQGYQGQKGVMPAKGGNTTLPDPDVKAAVDYMVAQGR